MSSYTYYYEHNYHNEEEVKKGASKRMTAVYSHPILLPRDRKYYMNCLVMNIQDPEISIFKLGVDVTPPYYSIKNRCNNALFLSFVLDGAGKVDETRFECGDLYFTVPMQKHTLSSDNQTPWTTVWIMIAGSYTEQLQSELISHTTQQWLKFRQPDDILKIAEFFIYNGQPPENAIPYIKGIVQTLLSYAVYGDRLPDSDQKITFSMQRMISKAKEEINQHLSTCTVASVANRIHLERKYFCRLFTAVTGVTPQDYILECKMNWVKTALIETNLSVNEIVTQIGYNHRNGLLAAFKKKFGCSPSEYRKMNR
ncbi:MAG: helix-turn-helix transcriptional regulator [Clostridia bacterium]|nr:helix-turn-helix transcriptional regulator [Clostridia bacterium]